MPNENKLPVRPQPPSGWPTDNRSRMTQFKGMWVIAHPERNPMVFDDGKWQQVKCGDVA